MASFTEGRHAGEHIVSEANGARSREQAILASGNLPAGAVLGKITNAGTTTVAADAGNTGDGTIGTVTLGATVQVGAYVITVIEPATSLGDFSVDDPNGTSVGTGTVGTEFVGGGLTFTLADGAADFVAGDRITITVDAGSGSYAALVLTATDGSAVAAAVLYGAVDASVSAQPCTINARDCEVQESALTLPDGISEPQTTTAMDDLIGVGIIPR